jgi:hypothetical protein
VFDFDRLHDAVARLREREIFFVGGGMKSGTTWLQLLLDRHPEICCSGEGHFPTSLVPLLYKAIDEYNENIAWKSESIFDTLPPYPKFADDARTYLWGTAMALQLAAQLERKPARIVGEKTPDNVRAFGLFAAVFPRARFVQIVRDGRDCAVSGWFHNLRVTPDWARETYGSLDGYALAMAEIWARDVGEGERFGDGAPGRYLRLRYEDLLTQPAAELTRVLDFLGAAADPVAVDACLDAASFTRLSGGRAQGTEDRASFFRKGEAGDWRNHLSAETEQFFAERAGGGLERLGYR